MTCTWAASSMGLMLMHENHCELSLQEHAFETLCTCVSRNYWIHFLLRVLPSTRWPLSWKKTSVSKLPPSWQKHISRVIGACTLFALWSSPPWPPSLVLIDIKRPLRHDLPHEVPYFEWGSLVCMEAEFPNVSAFASFKIGTSISISLLWPMPQGADVDLCCADTCSIDTALN